MVFMMFALSGNLLFSRDVEEYSTLLGCVFVGFLDSPVLISNANRFWSWNHFKFEIEKSEFSAEKDDFLAQNAEKTENLAKKEESLEEKAENLAKKEEK